jgi:hypothetical protein
MEAVTGVFIAFLVAAVPLALLVTKAVDTVRNLIDRADTMPKVVWNVLAFAFGAGLCLGWQYNLVGTLSHAVPALTNSTRFDGIAGQLLTGLAVGAMASFWHEKLSAWSAESADVVVVDDTTR